MQRNNTVNFKQDSKLSNEVSFNYLLERCEKLAFENGRLNVELKIIKQTSEISNKLNEKEININIECSETEQE